ncbi:MAG: TRAP transporter substrate-binding protein DctP [Rhodospirillales bacterium]|nr:TRAP transporter substrate-binding protein DctP [Rhodospirillales bacterium]MDE2573885.1 TRAP transporter substrate-binding protein DctP [Rhodospirillales bacterium]
MRLLSTSLLALAIALPMALPARAQTVLRFSTAAPPGDFLAKAMTSFKAELERTAPGAFKISLYPAGTLFRQGTEFPALQRGNLEMSTGTTFEVAQQVPAYGFLNRGYLIRDYAHLRKLFDGPFGATYEKVVAQKMGIQILAVGYLGTREVNLRTKREVRGPQDLAGITMRMPPGPEWQLLGRAIGVTPVPMGMPETYLGLKTGTIDGQENPLTILNAAKFYEVTQQVVLTAHLVQPVFFDIGSPVWNKLSPDLQAKLRAAAVMALKQNDAARLADEARIVKELAAKGLTITRVDLAAFRKNADKIYADAPIAKQWDKTLMAEAMAQ